MNYASVYTIVSHGVIYQYEPFYCEVCNKSYNYSSRWYHYRSNKHLQNVKILELKQEIEKLKEC